MTIHRTQSRRGGATSVEFAMVASVVLLLIIGLIVMALGVFRYQELARLARDGARYAAVRGADYARFSGKPAATATDVYQKAILPNAVILTPSKLSADITWSPDNTAGGQVTVTVRYQWLPETYFKGMTLSSTASMPVIY
ncbi:MAG TPA: TadE/TadG family type IV pilus assembly protein [Gemmataceae bacterium]